MEQQDENKEQDRYLPIANIGRIMKNALPGDAKIAKEARETVQECVSEFISFITSEACDKCKNDKRKTINGDDLVYSLYQLGFERYLDNLNLYYQKYKDAAKHNDKTEHSAKNNEQLVNSAQEAVQQSKYSSSATRPKLKSDLDDEEDGEGDEEDEEMEEDEEEEEEEEEEPEEEEMQEEEEESQEMPIPVKGNKRTNAKKGKK